MYKDYRLESTQQPLPVYPQDFSCSSTSETLLSCIIPTSIYVAPTTIVGISCTPPPIALRKFFIHKTCCKYLIYVHIPCRTMSWRYPSKPHTIWES